MQAVNATIAYRDALTGSGDAAARQAAVIKAQALVAEDPDLMIARRVVIDDLIRNQDWTAALAAIDAALARAPDNRQLYTIRLGVLNQLGETAEIRAQLEEIAYVDVKRDRAIVSFIADVTRSTELLAKVFMVLFSNGIAVEMLSQGASKVNISLVLLDADADRALKLIHDCFFMDKCNIDKAAAEQVKAR